jgi:hypothetical protein
MTGGVLILTDCAADEQQSIESVGSLAKKLHLSS